MLDRFPLTQKLLLGAALATSLIGCAGDEPDAPSVSATTDEIIGGFPASSPKLNAIGALGFDVGGGSYQPFCSGTLITPTIVLTAEHCVEFIDDPTPFAFLVGPNAWAPVQVVPARGAAVESTVVGGVIGRGSDIGVLHLAQPVTGVTPLAYAALGNDVGRRYAAVGYGVQDATGKFGTRQAGSMTLKATGGPIWGAVYGSFEGFLATGAPKYYPGLDPNNPDDLAILQQAYDEFRLLDGIEAFFGTGKGDAQSCFGDSGGPITAKQGDKTTVFGVASWVFAFGQNMCELDGGGYASLNPISLDFIDYQTKCPLIPAEGTCDGLNVAVRCATQLEGGYRELRTDCSELGLICGTDETGALGCIADPCEGLPAEGVCTGDVATRCSGPDEGPRHVVTTDCAAQGQSCGIQNGQAACFTPVTCDHDTCTTGGPLGASCGQCEADICAVDPFCCTSGWDSICVGEVQSVCGSDACAAPPPPPPTCDHDKCTEGTKLDASCGTCEADICTVDPYCCQTAWDSICVGEVGSVCGESCANTAGIDVRDIEERLRPHGRSSR